MVDRLLAWDFVYLVCDCCWLFTEFCWFVVFSPGKLARGRYLDVDCVLVIVDLVLDCVVLFIGWGVLAFAGRCACGVVCCVAFLDVFVWVFWLLSLCFFCL